MSEVTLKEYIESRLASLCKETEIAKVEMDRRMEAIFVNKKEFDEYKSKNDGDIRTLREYNSKLDGKASQSAVIIAIVIAVIGIIIAIAGVIIDIIK